MKRMFAVAAAALLGLAGLVAGAGPAQAAGYPSESFVNAGGAGCLSYTVSGRHGPPHPRMAACDFGSRELWTAAAPITDKAGNPTSSWLESDGGLCLGDFDGSAVFSACTTVTLPNGIQVPDFRLYWRLQDVGGGQFALVNVKSGNYLATDLAVPDLPVMVPASDLRTSRAWTVIPAGAA